MLSLSKKSQEMIDRLLNHYPISNVDQKENTNQHIQPKKPSQHLHDYRKEREIYEKSTEEKLQNMLFFKQEGNNHYKNGRFTEASYFYHKGIIYGDYTFPDSEEDVCKMNDLLQQCHCNRALCLIKLGKWDQVKSHLNEAIQGQNTRIKSKGYYWLTKYYLHDSQFEQAKQTLSTIRQLKLQIDCNCQELERQLSTLIQHSQKQSQDVYANMFKQ